MSRHPLTAGLLAGLICVGIAPALPQQGPPDFSANNAGWVSVGGEWTPLPGSPPPVKQDPAHHYVPNNVGGQPTFRIADINNANLTQFAKDSLKQTNDAVLAGKPMWSRSARCWATGPAFLLTPAQSMFFIQTPQQVSILAQHDNDVRRVYLNVFCHDERPPSLNIDLPHAPANRVLLHGTAYPTGLPESPFTQRQRWRHRQASSMAASFSADDRSGA